MRGGRLSISWRIYRKTLCCYQKYRIGESDRQGWHQRTRILLVQFLNQSQSSYLLILSTILVPKDGKEHYLESYELLCATTEDWVEKHGDTRNAVPAGIAVDGQSFYICRGKYMSSVLPGKYRRSIDCCFVPFATQEHCAKEYSVLVQSSPWVARRRNFI